MGVSTKSKRKITVDSQNYVWCVRPDGDSPFDVLEILSGDKSLVLCCPLKTGTGYLISKGRVFQARQTGGRWQRYLLPFRVPETITPKFVSEVILWASRAGRAAPAEWDGAAIPV